VEFSKIEGAEVFLASSQELIENLTAKAKAKSALAK
jgi:hypothetical protein